MTPVPKYTRVNALLLRNTRVANFLDVCAISVPCHALGERKAGRVDAAGGERCGQEFVRLSPPPLRRWSRQSSAELRIARDHVQGNAPAAFARPAGVE